MPSTPVVDVAGIALRRPNVLVLRPVDLRVAPAGGAVSVLGSRLGTPEVEQVRPRIGLIGHEPALYPHLTLSENLGLVESLCAAPTMSAADALGAVGLGAAGRRRAP